MRGERGWLVGAMLVASMVGGAVANLWLTARLGAQGSDVMTASQVNIVDDEGRLRVVLAGEDERGQATLTFYGPDGVLRGLVGADGDGNPVLRFNDPAGVTQLLATVRDDNTAITVGEDAARNVLIGSLGGTPFLGLADRGRTPLQLTLGGQGQPQLSLLNGAGQRSIGLVVGADDAPFLSLFDGDGAQRLAMGTVEGATLVNLGDGTRPRLVLGVADNGRASVAFYDDEGQLEHEVSAEGQ